MSVRTPVLALRRDGAGERIAEPRDLRAGKDERCGKLARVDPLRKSDIERMKLTPPEERLRAVFAAVDAGVRIRLATLRAKRPDATEIEIEAALRDWLLQDERRPLKPLSRTSQGRWGKLTALLEETSRAE